MSYAREIFNDVGREMKRLQDRVAELESALAHAAERERAAVKREREACAAVASPRHNVGVSVDGCPVLCATCSERRLIRDAIRARGIDDANGGG